MPEFFPALLAILMMGLITYGTRVGGYLAAGFLKNNRRLARVLDNLPACAIAALLMPSLLQAGILDLVALAGTVSVYWFTGRIFPATLLGLGILMLNGASFLPEF